MSGAAADQQEAMKFLLHFVGDVHQPLHAENLEVGGNNICIQWHGKRHNDPGFYHSHTSEDHSDRTEGQHTGPSADRLEDCPARQKCKNLHQVWDALIIEKLISYKPPDQKGASQQWATDLFGDTQGNPDLPDDDCVPTGSSGQAIDCASKWAGESNQCVCSYVLKDGVEGVENQELAGDYYEGAVPIVKTQITRAARRFAATMNAMASSGSAQ